MTDVPPAELLARLRPIPTYRNHPATSPHDVSGVDPEGVPRLEKIAGMTAPVVLLFLSADCLGCRDLWEGVDGLRAELPSGVRVMVVTRGPEVEDAAAVARLAAGTGTGTVMSSEAYADYRVAGPPFLVVVADGEVKTEGVAWGIDETARAARTALAG